MKSEYVICDRCGEARMEHIAIEEGWITQDGPRWKEHFCSQRCKDVVDKKREVKQKSA